jgi:hypothetical protein
MGPRSENRGYDRTDGGVDPGRGLASMGPRSENRGYVERGAGLVEQRDTSMGPRSENRGYGRLTPRTSRPIMGLQWVHGPRTVVMDCVRMRLAGSRWHFNGSTVREPWLCRSAQCPRCRRQGTSMGPRSENRGYGKQPTPSEPAVPVTCCHHWMLVGEAIPLQWVHGPRTVVMAGVVFNRTQGRKVLQWVHGPRTVVMEANVETRRKAVRRYFNGSTVRERRGFYAECPRAP